MLNADKLIGTITCVSTEDQPDGSCVLTFEYTQEFKDEYKKLYNLKRFSKKHFEKTLNEALINFANKVEQDKKNLELEEETDG